MDCCEALLSTRVYVERVGLAPPELQGSAQVSEKSDMWLSRDLSNADEAYLTRRGRGTQPLRHSPPGHSGPLAEVHTLCLIRENPSAASLPFPSLSLPLPPSPCPDLGRRHQEVEELVHRRSDGATPLRKSGAWELDTSSAISAALLVPTCDARFSPLISTCRFGALSGQRLAVCLSHHVECSSSLVRSSSRPVLQVLRVRC